MASKTQHNPTANLFSLLQNETGEKESNSAAPKATAPGAMTPADKARIRQAAQAEKDAALKAQQAADKERKEAEAAYIALAGPLDGFQVQKSSQPRKEKQAEKKKGREEFDKSPAQGRKFDGEKKPYEKRPYDPNYKKDNNKPPRQGESGDNKKPFARDPEKKHNPGHLAHHHGDKPPKRDFDKHSAGKTGRHFESKRQGEGGSNWGNAVTEGVQEVATGGWGEETKEVKSEQSESATQGWGGDDEPKTEAVAEEEKADQVEKAPKEPAKPSWDDEGFGKMTLQEYQAKVAAKNAAELAEKVGVAAPRKIENADLSKFVEKDFSDDKAVKKVDNKDKKKSAGPARTGEKPLELNLFDASGRGGRGGSRGGRGGGRAQNQKVTNGPKAFPDLQSAYKPAGAK